MQPERKYGGLGYIPDLPDQRDKVFKPRVTKLPPAVDLRPNMPLPPFDQGQLGSCTANATVGAIVYDQQKQKLPVAMQSRLALYYWSRYIEHTVGEDSGAMLRDVMKAYNKQGTYNEEAWPYDITKFAEVPPLSASDMTKPVVYQRVAQQSTDMRACLAAGYPFVLGFTVYDSFESDKVAKTGVVPMPKKTESVLGGHAVLAVGYDDKAKRFTCRNSWGEGWGMAGYCTMPYTYLTDPNLAEDFWVIKVIK